MRRRPAVCRAAAAPDARRLFAALAALATLICGLACAISLARAGGNIEAAVNGNTKIADAVWSPLALPIPWKINAQGAINNCDNGNPQCSGGVSPLTLQRATDAMTAAFNAWQNIPTSRVAFTYAGTSTVTTIGLDNVHLITWADGGTTNCPSGVVATTPNSHLTADLTVSNTNRDLNSDGIIDLDPAVYPTGTVLKAGTIVDADLAWCPLGNDFVDVPLDTTTNTFDMVAVATHELGHFHGMSHSSLVSPFATMLPFVDVTADYDNDARTLSQDDMAASSRSYPETAQAANFGSITGRVFLPGGVTGADGVSVTALRKNTGEMTVQVFSVSRFALITPPLPGSFRIDWLPAGDYYVGVEYFDSTTGVSGGGDDDWWDNNRFNLTILNSNVTGGTNPPFVARPEFYSSPETSTDDLADQVTVTVAAGQTADVGSIITNTDAPPAPAGTTALNMANSASVQVAFPAGFTFPFYGQSYASVFVNDNANLTFGAGSAFSHSGGFLGPDPNTLGPVPPRIAFPLTDLDPSLDNRGQAGGALDVFSRFITDPANAQNDRMEFTWLGASVGLTTKSCTAVARLFRSGRIEVQNRFFSAWWGVTGLSPGGTGSEPAVAIDISRQLPYSGSAGQAIYEHFEFAQPSSVGGTFSLRHPNDTNGSLLVFAPNAQGGYDFSSPNFVNVRPGEVLNQIFGDATHLGWDALAGAFSYNVYRGNLGSFTDADADGAADGYGACLDASLASPADVDATTPSPGAGLFYLVTGRNPAGEGTLGQASSGAGRPNPSPCP